MLSEQQPLIGNMKERALWKSYFLVCKGFCVLIGYCNCWNRFFFFSVMEMDLFSNTHLHKSARTVQGSIQIDCEIKTASSVDTDRFKLLDHQGASYFCWL